jgi:hypothetical protein
MFDQLSAEILASLIKGFPTTTTTTTTTKQNVDPAVHFVYSRVKMVCIHGTNWGFDYFCAPNGMSSIAPLVRPRQ